MNITVTEILNDIEENSNKLTYGRINGIIPATGDGIVKEQYALEKEKLENLVCQIREKGDIDSYYAYASSKESISIVVDVIGGRSFLTYYSSDLDSFPIKSFAAPLDMNDVIETSNMAIFTLILLLAYAEQISYRALKDKILSLTPEEILVLTMSYAAGVPAVV